MQARSPVQRQVCPKCGRREGIPLEFGYPTEETAAAVARGEIAHGGCCIRFVGEAARCRCCGHEWATSWSRGEVSRSRPR